MKTIPATLAFIVSIAHAPAGERPDFAALRIVEDRDGFVNVRSGPSTDSKVAGKVNAGSVVSIADTKGEWAEIHDDSGSGRTLYIHGSRLKKLDGWKEYTTGAKPGDSEATVKAAGMEAKVTSGRFNAEGRKVSREGKLVRQIDGHAVWGTDGELPKHTLSLAVTIGGKGVVIPPEATADTYEPNMDSLVVLTPGKAGDRAFVLMQNSDGAGGYTVVWAFSGGKYAGRTVLTY